MQSLSKPDTIDLLKIMLYFQEASQAQINKITSTINLLSKTDSSLSIAFNKTSIWCATERILSGDFPEKAYKQTVIYPSVHTCCPLRVRFWFKGIHCVISVLPLWIETAGLGVQSKLTITYRPLTVGLHLSPEQDKRPMGLTRTKPSPGWPGTTLGSTASSHT